MAERVPFTIPGALAGWVDTDVAVGVLGIAGAAIRTFVGVLDAPSGDTLTVDLRDATGGGGSGLEVVVADAANSGINIADQLDISATETVYIRVTQDSGAGNLYGWFEFDPTGTSEVSTFFTTLARVKIDEGLTAATYDAQLSRLIQGVIRSY